MAKLTAKKRLFAHEYLVDLNGTKAAIRAGYAETRARQTASDLLKETEVAALIEDLQKKRIEAVNADAQLVLDDLLEYRQANIKQVYDENGAWRPIHEWPDFFTRMGVVSIKTQEVYEKDESGKKVFSGYIREVKWVDPTKIVELIGKHINVNAFRDVKVHDVSDPLKQLYEELSGHGIQPAEAAPGLAKNAPPGIPKKKPAGPMAIRPKE